MAIRLTGLNSGMDTESIITELVKAKSEKKESLVKAQTKLQWKQDAWKELNSKVYSLYSKTLSNMRLSSDYMKKTTKVGNANAASVITGETAVNGVQTLKINQLATSGYLTGAELKKDGKKADYTSETKLTDLGIKKGSSLELKVGGETTEITVDADMTIADLVSKFKTAGLNASFDEKNQRFFVSAKESGKAADFAITAANSDGADAMKALGIKCKLTSAESAYYKGMCETQLVDGKYAAKKVKESDVTDLIQKEVDAYKEKYNSLKKQLDDAEKEDSPLTQEDKDRLKSEMDEIEKQCVISGDDWSASDGLKQSVIEKEQAKYDAAAATLNEDAVSEGATRIEGKDAEILLNGATFSSTNNTFEINGLTITANFVTEEEFTITTADDTDGIYDMIKNFFKEYNTLINEMDSLYNADSSKGYEPLTDDEKEAMSESEVEKWEEKIKKSILRKDSTLSTVSSAMKMIMLDGVEVNGKKMHLSDFGISTLGYFSSADNEKNAYHIDGDPDDTATSGNADKLKTAIANDSATVVEFFTNLSKNLYTKLGDLMKKTEYSSSFTLYDDVAMKDEYNDYKDKITAQEEKIADYEDRYYKKFAAMETALAKLQSNESAISSLLGM